MGSWMSQAIKTFIGSPLQHLNQAVNTSDFGEALNFTRSSVELEQFIIRLPPTMEMSGLLILQLEWHKRSGQGSLQPVLDEPVWHDSSGHPILHPLPSASPPSAK